MNASKVLLLIVAALVVGQLTGWPVADHLALALTGLLIAAWVWSRLSPRGLSLTRETATDRAQVGHPLREEVEIRNAGRLAKLWLEVVDHSTLPHHSVGRAVHIRGRGVVRWAVETPCVRRGRFRIGPLSVRSGDPLGLFSARLEVPGAHEIVVYPATVNLRHFPVPAGTLAGGSTLERRTPIATPNVAGVRDYTPGDSFNRISWTATARRGQLMVKEFDVDPTADVWLVLDLDQTVHLPASRLLPLDPGGAEEWPVEAWLDSTLEYAVTIVASLARRFHDQGRNVGLIASGAHLELIAPDRSDRQQFKLLETLAVVAADGPLPLAEVLVAEGRRFGRQSSVIVVTPATDERWVAALAEMAGRHVRVAAILVEPETFGPGPSSLLPVSGLVAAGIPVHLVKYGDQISQALAVAPGGQPAAGVRRG